MAGKIDCYIDIGTSLPTSLLASPPIDHHADSPASWYSYVAFADLRRRRAELAAHGVTIE